MDFELSRDEQAFEEEVVAFLEANRSPEVMDRNICEALGLPKNF